MENKKTFIVPYDYTEASEKALNQAVEISKHENAKIILLHAPKGLSIERVIICLCISEVPSHILSSRESLHSL